MNDCKPEPTPGPYFSQPIGGRHDIGIYSAATGECLAHVLSRSSGHEDAPPDPTALQNARLFVMAPQLRQTLNFVVEMEGEPLHPEIVRAARECLEGETSDHERLLESRELRDWSATIRTRMNAMEQERDSTSPVSSSHESVSNKGPTLNGERAESAQGRPPGHSPAPFKIQAVSASHDIDLYSSPRLERVATILSRESGHLNAPEDEVALHNAALFRTAPRMREALELSLERRDNPLHPFTAAGIRELLSQVEQGYHEAIEYDRRELSNTR